MPYESGDALVKLIRRLKNNKFLDFHPKNTVLFSYTVNPLEATLFVNGDGGNQPASMLVTHGQILITTDAKLCNIITTINELQCRQDELKQNFEPSIKALLSMVVHRE